MAYRVVSRFSALQKTCMTNDCLLKRVNWGEACAAPNHIYYPLINIPPSEGVIIRQTKNPFLGVIFDEDHGFEGPRAPKRSP
jgi:hypothetical protein